MRAYLFDTPIMAALVNHRPGAVALVSPWIVAHEAATSDLVYAEVFEYIRPSQRFLRHYQILRSLLRAVHPLGVNLPILERYADIRLALRRGRLIGDIDTPISATAPESDLTVVTIDPHFQRVPGLQVMLLTRDQIM